MDFHEITFPQCLGCPVGEYTDSKGSIACIGCAIGTSGHSSEEITTRLVQKSSDDANVYGFFEIKDGNEWFFMAIIILIILVLTMRKSLVDP